MVKEITVDDKVKILSTGELGVVCGKFFDDLIGEYYNVKTEIGHIVEYLKISDIELYDAHKEGHEVWIFISQPMSGLTEEEILANRLNTFKWFKSTDYATNKSVKVLDSLQEDFTNQRKEFNKPDIHPLEYLGNDIAMLKDADYVIFCKDWENSRGCRIEHFVAEEYKMNILYTE